MVTVVIPTYNCAKYISDAIESVLNQTYKDFEIIVIDDGSADNTKSVLQTYVESGKIKYIYQENMGPGAARNNGIKKSQGNYVAFLDADDVWRPEFLEKLSQKLLNHPDIGFVYCDNYFVDENRNIIDNYIRKVSFFRGNICAELFCDHFIMTPSVLIRRKCFTTPGLFDERLLVGEDYDLLLRLAYHFKVDYIKEKLWERRLVPYSLSRRDFILDSQNDLKTLKTFLRAHPEFYRENKQRVLNRLSNYYLSFGYKCLENCKNKLAFKQLLQSLKYRPSRRAIKNLILCLTPYDFRRFLMNWKRH